ncbi:MAG: hypothetical protein KF803_15610 [Cyclobacteriaceae bacterium]|nr:hypothetical protein [Cyclobacteriaceae bacterium]
MAKTIMQAWDDLDLQSAKHLLSQTEMYLEATIETAKVLTDRAINILQFSVPAILALVGVVFAQSNQVLSHLSFLSIIFLLVISYKALKVYELYEIHSKGSPVENLLSDEILSMDESTMEFAFVFNSIVLNNNLIIFNENANKQRRQHIYFIINTVKVGCVVVLLYAIFGYLVFQSVSVSQAS